MKKKTVLENFMCPDCEYKEVHTPPRYVRCTPLPLVSWRALHTGKKRRMATKRAPLALRFCQIKRRVGSWLRTPFKL